MNLASDMKEGQRMKVAAFTRHCETEQETTLWCITAHYHDMGKEKKITFLIDDQCSMKILFF